MTLDDLKYIFAQQIEESDVKLYFMLIDSDGVPVVNRHDKTDLEGLLPMLSAFQYDGSRAGMPRFRKDPV